MVNIIIMTMIFFGSGAKAEPNENNNNNKKELQAKVALEMTIIISLFASECKYTRDTDRPDVIRRSIFRQSDTWGCC